MIASLGYTLIFGKPLIMYLGILTYLCLISTAIIGYLSFKGITTIPFRWHPRLALAAIILATIHALFGLSIYFNF
jgi:hypothetical protein